MSAMSFSRQHGVHYQTFIAWLRNLPHVDPVERSAHRQIPELSVGARIILSPQESDGMSNGMQTMTHRTTFALDGATASRLRRLSSLWQVSQAEVVRRSLEQAEKQAEIHKPDPVAMLRCLHEKGGGLDRAQAEAYLAEMYEDRKHWRGL